MKVEIMDHYQIEWGTLEDTRAFRTLLWEVYFQETGEHYSKVGFRTSDDALFFAKLLLERYANSEDGGILEPIPGQIKKQATDILGLPQWAVSGLCSQIRFVGEPVVHVEPNCATLSRTYEARYGLLTKKVHEVEVEGEKYTRTSEETKWSEWYGTVPERISVYVVKSNLRILSKKE